MIAAFITYFVTGGFVVIDGMTYMIGGGVFTTYYVSLSVFLAYAACYPDMQILLWFVIPIKMKWMLVFELLYLAYIVFNTFKTMIAYANGTWLGWVLGLVQSSQIILAVANMFLFFWASKTHISRKQKKRQRLLMKNCIAVTEMTVYWIRSFRLMTVC